MFWYYLTFIVVDSIFSTEKFPLKETAKICVGGQFPVGAKILERIPTNVQASGTYVVKFSDKLKEEDITTDGIIYKCHSCPVGNVSRLFCPITINKTQQTIKYICSTKKSLKR